MLCEGRDSHEVTPHVDLFLTNEQDPTKVDNSSYLDLSPLYGSNQAQQDGVRTFVDGKLKPDAFADARESMFDFIESLAGILGRYHSCRQGILASPCILSLF